MLSYQISYDDKIIATSADWDQAAWAQSSPGATTAKVLGASIWSVVQGDGTQSYLNALFFMCRRTGQPLTAYYRCDTPTQAQFFRMVITPMAGNALQIAHYREPIRAFAPMVQTASKWQVLAEQWSQCLRVQASGQWSESFPVVPVGGAETDPVVCPSCRQAALQAARREPVAATLYALCAA